MRCTVRGIHTQIRVKRWSGINGVSTVHQDAPSAPRKRCSFWTWTETVSSLWSAPKTCQSDIDELLIGGLRSDKSWRRLAKDFGISCRASLFWWGSLELIASSLLSIVKGIKNNALRVLHQRRLSCACIVLVLMHNILFHHAFAFDYIRKGGNGLKSVLITDGAPCYPRMAKSCRMHRFSVNHSKGESEKTIHFRNKVLSVQRGTIDFICGGWNEKVHP